jgi:hypothetical protein
MYNGMTLIDIFARGDMTWKSAMGDTACVAACLLARAAAADAAAAAADAADDTTDADADDTKSVSTPTLPTDGGDAGARAAVVIDPFCGQGTALAVANELGMGSCHHQ